MTDIELRSLAPEYIEDHHRTYVSRLNAAVSDSRNKNIALTGRYGAGKSSILDEFIKGQEKPDTKAPEEKKSKKKASPRKVLRISINTLGPDNGEDLTNRIQKELVKQLVYRAKPGELRSSEFARAPELTWWRAGLEAFIAAIVIVGLLWLFELRPNKDALGTDGFLWPMIAFFVLVFAILWAIRWYIGSRVVAQVSAGGASIALEGKSDSFFDKYLDELIAFFEATEPDIVVFEDLDRFDDPRIFDSLRELNTLVNTSAHWKHRQDRPLRFVYAIKDSLFEKLGDKQLEKDEAGKQSTEEGGASTSGSSVPAATIDGVIAIAPKAQKKDAAAVAVERANRTKFFEIVIPVVPFLSHSNARDHFLEELGKLNLPKDMGAKIERGLIDIVARHTTDMRLMINIGNEFVVYAERLLWVKKEKRAPGLTPDLLLALVVYKNFHPADFEALPHRGSALDKLDQARRDLVDENIKLLERERANLASGATRRQGQQELATRLGDRLAVILQTARMTLATVTADEASLDVNAPDGPSFWQILARADKVGVNLESSNYRVSGSALDRAQLTSLFPELDNSRVWLNAPTLVDGKRLSEIDAEIATLRGADFKALIDDGRYKLNGKTFEALSKEVLPSQLAHDLIKQGYIERFYAEYATVFYGKFLGVDVAKFFRNSVWPNEVDMQFSFKTEGAMANVLEQAPADFLRTRSALNIDIVNHLMSLDGSYSSDLIDLLARPNNTDGMQFLTTYFITPKSRSVELVSRLAAKPWPQLFSFIASEGTIDADETNVRLLNAALLNARDFDAFELDDAARALIARLHAEIPAFRDAQPGASLSIRFAFLADALQSVPRLRALSHALQGRAVTAKQYDLNANNLRAAASLAEDASISADNLIAEEMVWEYCAENIDDYLELIESDEHTTASCTSPAVLAQVVNAQHKDWSAEQMVGFLDASADSAALPNITVVEQVMWETMVERLSIAPNVTNLETYVTEIGIDDALAGLLVNDAGDIIDLIDLNDATEEQLEILIPRALNAEAALTPSQRVQLAAQLLAAPESPGLELSTITASPDELFAELLRKELVGDNEDVFTHFSSAGWASIGPALQVSKTAATFLTPALIQGHAAEVVREKTFPETTRRAVLGQLTELAPAEDAVFLAAAASAARTLRVLLSTDALALIAPAAQSHEDIVWQLSEHGGAVTADQALQILGCMSGAFAGFAGTSGHKFAVADTASLKAVLDRLKDAGVIAFQSGRQPRGRWKLRIV